MNIHEVPKVKLSVEVGEWDNIRSITVYAEWYYDGISFKANSYELGSHKQGGHIPWVHALLPLGNSKKQKSYWYPASSPEQLGESLELASQRSE